MAVPNIGEAAATADGASGSVWGVRQNGAGIFVQFSAGDDWRLIAETPPAAPSPPTETPNPAPEPPVAADPTPAV